MDDKRYTTSTMLVEITKLYYKSETRKKNREKNIFNLIYLEIVVDGFFFCKKEKNITIHFMKLFKIYPPKKKMTPELFFSYRKTYTNAQRVHDIQIVC